MPTEPSIALRRRQVERVLNILILLSGIACAVAWGWYFARHNATNQPIDEKLETYAPGERLPEVGLPLERSEQALVLFVMSNCSACAASMPFYRRVIEQQRSTGSTVPLFVISFDKQNTLEGYLRRNDVNPDVALFVDYERVKLRRTPTILLVDRHGIVLKVWQGRLRPDGEAEILDILAGRPVQRSGPVQPSS